MTIEEKRQEILKELKRSITFYLDGYASYIREGAPCGLDEEQVLNLTAMEVDHILKDYGAIVEQQTRDAVIEEIEQLRDDRISKIINSVAVDNWDRLPPQEYNCAAYITRILKALKSNPTPEEKL